MVVLYKVNVDTVLLQRVFPEDFRKEPSRIDMTNRLEELNVCNLGFDNLHRNCSPRPLRCFKQPVSVISYAYYQAVRDEIGMSAILMGSPRSLADHTRPRVLSQTRRSRKAGSLVVR